MSAAIIIVAAVILLFVVLMYHHSTLGEIVSEIQDAVDAVTAQLGHAKDEIVSEIAKLEAAVVAGDPVDLTALKAAAQALDDVVVDVEVPVEVPVDEPVDPAV